MRTERKRFRFEILLEKLISKFPKILLTNLLFAIPSLPVLALCYFLNLNVLFSAFSIIIIYPFYAGVVVVMRNIVRGDENIPVVSTFVKAIKDNFLLFLFHGVIISVFSFISTLSIRLYIRMLSESWIFYVFLFICLIILLFVFYAMLYLPLMSVTVKLKKKYLYKNSILMSYGEFKNNLFATLALAVLLSILLTLGFAMLTVIPVFFVFAIIWTLFLPAVFTLVYITFIYDDMYQMVSQEAIDAAASLDVSEPEKPKKPAVTPKDFSSIDVSKLKNTDDYIFYNGKMVKQSTLLKMINEEQQEVNTDE